MFPPAWLPFVNDDFGDVFGFFFAISGESFTNPELVRYAEQLGANWCWFPALAKSLSAVRSQQINIDISLAKWPPAVSRSTSWRQSSVA
jgi:hypothetical protein